MNRYWIPLRVPLALAVLLVLAAALTGSVTANTDSYLDVAFHPFTLDGGNSTCVPYDDSDVDQTRNCDPVNLVFPDRTWQQVRDLLLADDWSTSGGGSSQWLYFGGSGLIVEDEQLFKPGTLFGPRYHIRLWQAPGETLVTFAAVHHEDFFHNIDMAWDEAEAIVASALCGAGCGQVELATQIDIQVERQLEIGGDLGQWRSEDNDGWAKVIPGPGTPDNPPTVTIVDPAAGSTVAGMTPVTIQAGDDIDAAGALTVLWRIDNGGWLPAAYNASNGAYEATWDTTTVADGDYLFQAQATDSGQNTTGASHTVTVDNPNASPLASFTISCADLSCDFDAGASSDTDGNIVDYAWDFGDETGDSGINPTTSHTYDLPGTYTVVLTVTDNEDATGADNQSVTVSDANYLPLVVFNVDCASLSCDFDASDSSDPDGTIVDYAWEFGDGDGSSGNSPTTSHTYPSAGTYRATLTVTDNDSGMTTDSQDVTVVDAPASTLHVGDLEGVSANVKKNWLAVVTITVHDEGENPVAGAVVSGVWNGDASGTGSCETDAGGTCNVEAAEMPKKNTYYAIFMVTGVQHGQLTYDGAANHDPQGNSSGTMIQVNQDGSTLDPGQPQPQPPVADFTFACPDLTCSFDGSGAYDPDGGDIGRYDWDFGDGVTAVDGGVAVSHAYAGGGSWQVTLTVYDDEGETNSLTQSVAAGEGGAISLTAVGYKVKAIQRVDLTWSGITTDQVDIYRDGENIATRPNADGAYTDNLEVKRGGPYTYQVCQAGSITVCSEVVVVEF